AGRRMPPVLHVALDELTRRAQDEMCTAEIRPRIQQRQNVLHLVAESEGASRLVRAAARPDATTERLVRQPPIHQKIERVVRGVDLYRAEGVFPESRRARDGLVHFSESGVSRGECHGV